MAPIDLKRSKWFPLILTAVVLPGLGQIYLKERVKGYVLAGFSLLVVLGAFARFMSVLFALAHVRARGSFSFRPAQLVMEAWRLDQRVLLAFIGGFIAIWLLSILDILVGVKKVP